MRRLLSAAALAVLGVVGAAAPVWAHTGLVEGSPGPGDEVAPGSTIVALRLEELDRDGPMRVAVLDASDEPIAVGEAVPGGGALVCARTEPLRPGVHTIEYTVTAPDGHEVRSRYAFEVRRGADPAGDLGCPPPGDMPAPEEDAGSLGFDTVDIPGMVLGAGAGVVVIAAALAAVRLVRSRREQPVPDARTPGS